ncbi:carbon-nitrogen hydrolase family protein [Qipengyuania sp. MTN3-11]|uniref:carbon-nitrogen hydrolase family protein n=1 Tax=Qipengyuania sp. MTN3-11 TaxID=3056557 RepID=UPI0036F36517
MPRIAVLQMTSGIDPEANAETILRALADAREGGAKMLLTPEMSLLLDRDRQRAAPNILGEKESPFLARFANAAREQDMWLTVGAPVRLDDGKFANRQWVFDPACTHPVSYDKIHMFDVTLADGESWRESNAYRPGEEVVTIEDTPVRRLGLTTCYDIRFPALFEALGRRRCDLIAIPAAFTCPTGAAHWHTLVRARAIEASAFVVAPAQVGSHEDGRLTYGHSLVVDPWGEVLLDMGGEKAGLGFADVDLARIDEVRRQVPSLANRREIAN